MFWFGIDLKWAYASLLPSIAFKTHCPHQAKDILHDGLIRFALTPSDNRDINPHAYLRTIVQNLVHADYRQQQHLHDYLQQIDTDEAISPSPETLADLRQRLTLLTQIIEDLPPRCREVFVLYRIEGLRQTEIAARLNISLNMVERHLIRALIDIKNVRTQVLG